MGERIEINLSDHKEQDQFPAGYTSTTPLHWNSPGDINLSDFYDTQKQPEIPRLVFARSDNCIDTVCYIDAGVILEARSSDTSHPSSFYLAIDLSRGKITSSVHVSVEFDVLEVQTRMQKLAGTKIQVVSGGALGLVYQVAIWVNAKLLGNKSLRFFRGAVSAVATTEDLSTGKGDQSVPLYLAPSTCHIGYDPIDQKLVSEKIKLNFPGGFWNLADVTKLPFEKFRFFRSDFDNHPVISNNTGPLPANRSANNLVLQLKMNGPLPGANAMGTGLLTQDSATSHWSSGNISNLGDYVVPSNWCKSNGIPISAIKFAGVGLNITAPKTTMLPANPGPIRVRIKKLSIEYS